MNLTADALTELHRLNWSVLTERVCKQQAQLQVLQGELRATTEKLNAFMTQMHLAYALGEQDRIDLETGAITRAPPPAI